MQYKIEFFTYWHTGSGLSAGTAANATVLRNKQDLPYISGKTLKGLLREAGETINGFSKELVSDEFLKAVFGTGQLVLDAKRAELEKEGKDPNAISKWAVPTDCFFSNAELSQNLSEKLKEETQWLYHTIHSTAIDTSGIAKKNALRSMEVTIPLTLFAKIEDFPNKAGYADQLAHCMNWIKRLGVNRNRGLGRCQWHILENGE